MTGPGVCVGLDFFRGRGLSVGVAYLGRRGFVRRAWLVSGRGLLKGSALLGGRGFLGRGLFIGQLDSFIGALLRGRGLSVGVVYQWAWSVCWAGLDVGGALPGCSQIPKPPVNRVSMLQPQFPKVWDHQN